MHVVWKETGLQVLEQVLADGLERFGARATGRLLSDIYKCERLLADYPYIGKQEPFLEHLHASYRSIVVQSNFKLIYKVYEEQQIVRIFTLWDTRRNPRQLENDVNAR